MKTRKRLAPTDPHPLEGVVLAAFKSHPVHDRMTMAPHLGGTSAEFVAVAGAALAHMASRGKLWRDEEGMYRVSTGELTVAEECHARRNCRVGLVGQVAVIRDGTEGEEIIGSKWEAGGVLMLKFAGRNYISGDQCRLVSKWKATCCRPSRKFLEAAIARRLDRTATGERGGGNSFSKAAAAAAKR
jgi:hypothetical protein